MEWYLPVIWAALIGTAVAMYVILDGFDLGIGILFPFARSEVEKDQMMNSVAPFWDGNETWLFRGVAFEFRHVADTSRVIWNVAFAGGSTLAAFFQGVLLGGFVQGMKVEN